MLRVRSTRNCTNAPRVRFALEEAGVAYQIASADDGWFTATYGIPGPTLEVDDGFVIIELGAILRHVARAHGAGTLMPADLHGQASVDRWLDFQHRRISPAQHAGDVAQVRALLSRLDAQLAGRDYVLGRFTIADCGLSALVWGRSKLPALDDLGHLSGYLDRLEARPGWARALERMLP